MDLLVQALEPSCFPSTGPLFFTQCLWIYYGKTFLKKLKSWAILKLNEH